jgi:protein SCO1/2
MLVKPLKTSLVVGALVWSALGSVAPLWAHGEEETAVNANKQGKNLLDTTGPQAGAPKDLDKRVGIDQNLESSVPLNLEFKDENGKLVTLGQYYKGRPVMLSMLQLTCDQVCSAQFSVMAQNFNDKQFGFNIGKEFEMITVSLDPREGPLIAKDVRDEQLKSYLPANQKGGWHFLTGDEKNIKALSKALGIKYIWDEGTKQYIHPDGLVLTTPDAKISRYFMQLDYGPRDLRFSLIEASKEKIGSVIDRIALSCFHYNPSTGKYSFRIMSFLRWVGGAFVLGGLLSIGLMLRLEKRRKGTTPTAGPQLKNA